MAGIPYGADGALALVRVQKATMAGGALVAVALSCGCSCGQSVGGSLDKVFPLTAKIRLFEAAVVSILIYGPMAVSYEY